VKWYTEDTKCQDNKISYCTHFMSQFNYGFHMREIETYGNERKFMKMAGSEIRETEPTILVNQDINLKNLFLLSQCYAGYEAFTILCVIGRNCVCSMTNVILWLSVLWGLLASCTARNVCRKHWSECFSFFPLFVLLVS
jgi:hypothetical protein